MPSSAVTKPDPSSKDITQQQPAQESGSAMEAKEHSSSANASAGLNLNLAGAVSGLFASKSDKGTAADGSTTEHREERAGVKGKGAGNLNAVGAANVEDKGREVRQSVRDGKT